MKISIKCTTLFTVTLNYFITNRYVKLCLKLTNIIYDIYSFTISTNKSIRILFIAYYRSKVNRGNGTLLKFIKNQYLNIYFTKTNDQKYKFSTPISFRFFLYIEIIIISCHKMIKT